METAREIRRAAIAAAIAAELQRQAQAGAQRIDVQALSDGVLRALDAHVPLAEGRRPEELNSSNDG